MASKKVSIVVELRTWLDLTQAQLADMLAIPVTSISRYETTRAIPPASAAAVVFDLLREVARIHARDPRRVIRMVGSGRKLVDVVRALSSLSMRGPRKG